MQSARSILSIGWNKPKRFAELGMVSIEQYINYLSLLRIGFSPSGADEYIRMTEDKRQILIASAQKVKQDEQDKLDLIGL